MISVTLIDYVIAVDADTDGDGLTDSEEIKAHTDVYDADSDDDGVLDGDEVDWNKNTDKKGDINALDFDSDDDGIWDGVEMGITEDDLTNDTDKTKNHFKSDTDPSTNTSMIHWDTDSDRIGDGDEDKNKNGKYEVELSETDPLFPDRDNDSIADHFDDDIDGDGMSNEFEKTYGLDTYDPSDANFDDDNDGFSNLREYLGDDNTAGNYDWSNPIDPDSIPDLPPEVNFVTNNMVGYVNGSVVIDEKKLEISDSLMDIDKGLYVFWNWGDGTDDVDLFYSTNKFTKEHIYRTPGVYVFVVKVVDQHENMGTDSMIFDIQEISNPNKEPTDPSDKKNDGNVDPDENSSTNNNEILSIFLTLVFVGLLLVLIFIITIFIIYWPRNGNSENETYEKYISKEERVIPLYLNDMDRSGRQHYNSSSPNYYHTSNRNYKRPPVW